MKIKVRKISEDYWGNKRVQNIENENIYTEVDGRLHTTTREGEPDCPLKRDLVIEVVE